MEGEEAYEAGHVFRQPRKADCLPISKHPYGYVQRAAYRQPDLHHEEIVELDSPFASVVASGTQVYTFLLLGDQNAGKSTFLHAFCFAQDLNFLELTSYLPILASSFINTRFLTDDTSPPRDELPFLDTDIARGTVLLTLDSFVFFLDEFGLPNEEFPPDTRFVLVQFIEIGGDHLDSLMSADKEGADTSREMRDILDRSAALLTQARKTIYFINAATLFEPSPTDPGTHAINRASLDKLTERLSWLSTVLPASHQILFYLSRVPSGCTLDMRSIMPVVEAADRAAGLLPLALPTEGAPEQQIKLLLDHLKRTHKWRLDVVDVFKSEHLQEAAGDDNTTRTGGDTNELPLNVDKIVGTLVRLFQQGMQHSKREAEVFTFTHILQCWKREFLDKQPGFYEDPDAEVHWLHADEFAEYLEGLEFCELPETILLQQWDKVGRRLVDSALAIERNGETSCFSRFAIACSQAPGGGEVHLHCTQRAGSTPSTQRSGAGNYLEMRLFYFAPLMDVLYSYFAKNIPGEFWIDHSDESTSTSAATTPVTLSSSSSQRLSFLDDLSVRSRLSDAVEAMEERLRSLWQALVDAPAEPEHERQAVHFLWLVEEWLHAQQMLAPAGDARLTLPCAASATERIKALFDLLHRLCPQ